MRPLAGPTSSAARDDLSQAFIRAARGALDEESRALVTDSLASHQVVCAAMDAERAPVGAGPHQAEVVRSRVSCFKSPSPGAPCGPGGWQRRQGATRTEPASFLLAGQHGLGLALKVNVGVAADIDRHPLDRAAGEKMRVIARIVVGH